MINLKKCCLNPSSLIIDALEVIETSGHAIALVVEDDMKLVGILTDGNVRRAILNGAALDSAVRPFINTNFVSVSPKEGRAEVIDLMQARYINVIPVVDDRGILKGLHFLHELLGVHNRPNWAVIMAGGRGQRLFPITKDIPKPMITVAGRPILERIVLHLVSFGIRSIFLSINYLGHIIKEHFGDGSRFGCQIEYLCEEVPLGTGGALSLLPSEPGNPLLVLNGDLLTQIDIGALLDFHSSEGFDVTVGARKYCHRVPFGVLETSGAKLIRIEEKPLYESLINAGVYVLSPAILNTLPQGAFPITKLIENSLLSNASIGVFEIHDEWLDVGRFEQLRQAREGA